LQVNDLYIKYPAGGEEGWFAFVHGIKTFAYWDMDVRKWLPLDPNNRYTLFMTAYEEVDTAFKLKPQGCVYVQAVTDQQLTLPGDLEEDMLPGYAMTIRVRNADQTPITLTLPMDPPIENEYGGQITLQPGAVTEFSLLCYGEGKFRLSNDRERLSEFTLEKVADEAQTREAADNAEATTRANADMTLGYRIDREIDDRIYADDVLQTNINNEATARAAADGTLQANIDAEAATRASVDSALQNNIDSLNDYVDFMRGAQTISTVSGIQAMGTTTATITASAALSIANPARIKPGYVMSVRVRNMSGALIYVTLPTSVGWEVDKWYQAAVYPGKVTEIIFRGIANGLVAITYMVNKNSESVLSPNNAVFDAAGNILV
jgi:hypothetical protein